MTTMTKKHRATEPLPVADRVDAGGGAHRASRTPEFLIAAALGGILLVLLAVLATRG